jgi:hypothetical protein
MIFSGLGCSGLLSILTRLGTSAASDLHGKNSDTGLAKIAKYLKVVKYLQVAKYFDYFEIFGHI